VSQRRFPQRVIDQLLREARFEMIPLKNIQEEAGLLPKGATLTITASPRKNFENTMPIAEALLASGYNVIPHLMARGVRDREHLKDMLNRLTEGGFTEVFVIGGDLETPVGKYDSAVKLIKDIVEMENRPKHIGVGAYPEGHPLIVVDELFRALQEKQRYVDYMVTQICFDTEKIGVWLGQVREQGINLPVYIGIPGVLKRAKLLEISMRVGVGESTRFLVRHLGMFTRLLRRDMYSPDEMITGIAKLAQNPDYKIQGLHIYTFNQCLNTERWRQKILKK
jgi:methylenetetrahydrofolate reductase (NADPH)